MGGLLIQLETNQSFKSNYCMILLDMSEMDESVENIVVSHSKPMMTTKNMIRTKMGYQPIKTLTISSGKIDFKHIIGQILFESFTTKFYNIRKPVLIEYINDNGGHIKKSSNLLEIIEKVKEISYYEIRTKRIIRCIGILQKKFRNWINNPDIRLLGPGIPVDRCVNEECPFTFENLKDLDSGNVITWKGDDSKIYGCDYMSLFTLLKNTLGGRTIHTDKYEELISILNDIVNQQTDTQKRSSRINRRNMIFNEMKNPFTREKFQPELLIRLLHLANKRDMIKPKKQTTRSRNRNRTNNTIVQNRPSNDLIGAGVTMNNRISGRIIHSTEDTIDDWNEQLENGSRITNLHIDLENITLRAMYEQMVEMITIEQNLADEIRKVGFYVPDSMFSSVMNPVRECLRILSNDFDEMPAIPIVDVHLAGLIHSIRQCIVPFYERINLLFTNPVFIGALNRTRTTVSNIIQPNTILYGIRSIMRNSGIIYSVNETHRLRLINISKHLAHLILVSWVYCIRHLLFEIFTRGQTIHISTGESLVSDADRQTIAILLISTLVHTGHLGSDFEWAM